MKKIITLVAVISLCFTASAQYYYNLYQYSPGRNPGQLNSDGEYPVGGGLPAGWTTISTAPSATASWSTTQTIPFSFNFNGAPQTQFKVSTSGVLTFTTSAVTAPSYTNASIPNAAIPDNSVMVWGITATGTNDYIVTKTFGTTPNRQMWVLFSSFTSGVNYTYFSIVLEETSNKIYIVDQRHSATITGLAIGIQINSTTAYAVNNGSNNVSSLAGVDAFAVDNAYYEFNYGARPQNDMAVMSNTMVPYLILGQAPFNVTGKISSFGSQNVTSFELSYSVNGGPAVAGTINSVNIPTNGSYNFTHPIGWTPSASGTYNFDVWPSLVNGSADQNLSNDHYTFQVNVVDTFVVRQTCMEVFTSSTCGPCAPGNLNMEQNVIPFISNYTVIKYQQDFPGSGDPYRTPEAVNRRAYYNINSIPRMEIDGQWDGNAQSLTTGIYNGYQAEPAFMTVNIASATYTGTTVNVSGTITPHINYAASTYRYHVVVTEKQTLQNTATNGETEFLNVMMNMEPTETGNAISALNAGTPINFTKTISLPYAAPNSNTCCHVEEMSDLRVVVFVQNNGDKKILQSAWRDVILATGVAEIDVDGNGIAAVYPNPVNNFATVKFQLANSAHALVTVTNVMGQVVYQSDLGTVSSGVTRHSLNTESFSDGIYNVTLQADGKLYTHKFVISR